MTAHNTSACSLRFSWWRFAGIGRSLRIGLAALMILFAASVAVMASISFVLQWGGTGLTDGKFLTPTGIAVDSAGNVYVAEGNGNRFQKFDNNGNFLLKAGIFGDVPGGFVTPSGIAVDSAGNIYVTDNTTNRTSKFNSSGTFLSSIGPGGFLSTTGVAVDSANNVYISDGATHTIRKYNSSGTFITSWGGSGSGDGQFSSPQGLAIDSTNNVYVADTGNNRIQKFNSSGGFLAKWGTAGNGNGQFNSPFGVTADTSGNIFVVDLGNSRIQSFTSTGTFNEAFGTAGSGDGQFSSPQDVAADAAGNIFVVDSGNDRVEKLTTAAVAVLAKAGADQTVECAGATTSVTLDGTDSTGTGTLTYTWREGATTLGSGATLSIGLPLGVHTITLTVSSSGGGSATDDVIITISDTTAPVITLNGANPMTVECHTSFTDPGATANDGCAGSFAATASGTVNVNVPGTYTITYNASDPSGNAASPMTRTVNVVDTTAPVITLNGNEPVLWTPNHEYHTFTVTDFVAAANDSCNTSLGVGNVVISQVTSDEAEDADGDGHTLNDIVIAADCRSVQLRAERDGGADGRFYIITFKVTDSSGNVGTATARVVVPVSQGSPAPIDSGARYTVVGSCP